MPLSLDAKSNQMLDRNGMVWAIRQIPIKCERNILKYDSRIHGHHSNISFICSNRMCSHCAFVERYLIVNKLDGVVCITVLAKAILLAARFHSILAKHISPAAWFTLLECIGLKLFGNSNRALVWLFYDSNASAREMANFKQTDQNVREINTILVWLEMQWKLDNFVVIVTADMHTFRKYRIISIIWKWVQMKWPQAHWQSIRNANGI